MFYIQSAGFLNINVNISYFISGHSRSVQIAGCVEFIVTTNACRGFCLSYAIPSSSRTLVRNPQHKITSRAECCSIEETHDVSITLV